MKRTATKRISEMSSMAGGAVEGGSSDDYYINREEFLKELQLREVIRSIISSSEEAFEDLDGPFSMVFIDGGHSKEAAVTDYKLWSSKLTRGGLLAIHDVFPNPDDGGRPPYDIYCMALESNNFEKIDLIGSLGLLKKIK